MSQDGFSREDVLAEQDRILRDPAFARAAVLSRLLRYLVAETLAGRGQSVSAYQIATECFGRPKTFDPQADSYPRVQAARLRKLLSQHYRADAHRGNVVLDLVPGDYRVRLARPEPRGDEDARGGFGLSPAGRGLRSSPAARAALWAGGASALTAALIGGLLYAGVVAPPGAGEAGAPRAAAAGAVNMARPTLVIGEIGWTGRHPRGAQYAERLTLGLRAALPNFRRLIILSGAEDSPQADYRLAGSLLPAGNEWKLALTLTDQRGAGEVVWSGSRRITGDDGAWPVEDAVTWAASVLGQQRGVIHAREARAPGTAGLTGYRCLMRWRDHFDSPDAEERREVRRCLEK
ncbi:MAG TPA: hypothetical protein VFJ13_07370, partial [Paracoccaceae bacterium]|nr:hypothetical protein [Paracoccaceae bacterium]